MKDGGSVTDNARRSLVQAGIKTAATRYACFYYLLAHGKCMKVRKRSLKLDISTFPYDKASNLLSIAFRNSHKFRDGDRG